MDQSQTKPFLAPLRRLRWKLTLSYTLVTVGTILALEFILLVGLIFLLGGTFLNELAYQSLQENVIPRSQSYLKQNPPDLAGLQLYLDSLIQNNRDIRFTESNNANTTLVLGNNLTIDEDGAFLYVLDADLNLLAQTPKQLNTAVANESFPLENLAEAQSVLINAANGSRDPDTLTIRLSNGQNIIASPILNDEQGDVLGIVVLTFDVPIWEASTLFPLLTALLISAVPFTIGAAFIGTIFGFLTARGLSKRIHHVTEAAEAWSLGDFSVFTHDASADELGQLSRRLNLMAEHLQNLLESREELATLEERNRLARDLHDSVKQQVFATTMQLGAAKTLIQSDPKAASQHISEAEKLAMETQQELSILIQELRPAALGDQGLAQALRSYVTDWSQQTKIKGQVRTQGEQSLSLSIEKTLFRVTQEALSNVARHSQAVQVDVHLAWENESITLTIQDNGRGLPEKVQSGVGLQSMQERVEAQNGRFQISSQPQQGTTVTAVLPCSD